VIIQNTAPGQSGESEAEATYDRSGNLLYFTVRSGDTQLYGRMVKQILLDQKARNVTSTFNLETLNIAIDIPQFWYSIVVDPNYSVLVGNYELSDKGGGKNRVPINIILGVIVPVAGVILLGILCKLFVIPRLTLWWAMRGKEPSMRSIPMERLDVRSAGVGVSYAPSPLQQT